MKILSFIKSNDGQLLLGSILALVVLLFIPVSRFAQTMLSICDVMLATIICLQHGNVKHSRSALARAEKLHTETIDMLKQLTNRKAP